MSIGADSQGTTNFFIGSIDDVAVYDTALSSLSASSSPTIRSAAESQLRARPTVFAT